jgi:ArsR family transcriptional regulator
MERIAQSLRLLGDETRLRLLRLLSNQALNVSELTQIVGLAQSGISRHLSHLRKMGVIQERKEGVWSYYHLTPLIDQDDDLRLFGQYLHSQLDELDDPHHDQLRLQEILHQRSLGGPGLNEKLLEPGQSWSAWSRLLGRLISNFKPNLQIADLGCGDGTLTLELARCAEKVFGVDFDGEPLRVARKNLQLSGLQNVEWLQEPLEELSLLDESVDVVVFSQALHHLKDPEIGLKQANRICRKGGCLLVAELDSHKQWWVRDKLQHAWQGFSAENLHKMLRQSGWQQIHLESLPPTREKIFQVLLGIAQKQ